MVVAALAARDQRYRDDRRLDGPDVCRCTGRDGRLPGLSRACDSPGGPTDRCSSRSRSSAPASAGVTLNASNVTVQGNYIGLLADGNDAAGNRGDGIRINAVIPRRPDRPAAIRYRASATTTPSSVQHASRSLAGRASATPHTSGQYLITGTSDANGLLYDGPISGAGGTSYAVNVPGRHHHQRLRPRRPRGWRSAAGRQLQDRRWRRPRLPLPGDDRRSRTEPATTGRSTIPARSTPTSTARWAAWRSATPTARRRTCPLGTGHAFLYSVAQSTFLTDIVYPGSTSTTAYGIWYNGGTSYTICGGYSVVLAIAGQRSADGYLVDYDSATGQFTHWTSFDYPNGPVGQDFVTHFEGISSTEKGVYTLSADSVQIGHRATPARARGSRVRRNTDGSFGPPTWVNLNYPGADRACTSANSVSGNQVVGIVIGAARASPRTRRRSTSASSSPTSSAATAATASESTGPAATRSP